jgi:hypothetical protein
MDEMIKASTSLQELRKKDIPKGEVLIRHGKRHGFGWNRWSSAWLYNTLGLYNDYKIRYYHA